jgi:hypothetical protein
MADNTDVTIIYSIPHLIFNSVLYSQPEKAETVDDEIENDITLKTMNCLTLVESPIRTIRFIIILQPKSQCS